MQFYITVALIIILGVAVLIVISRRRTKFSKRDASFIASQWEEIRERTAREPRIALIEADKLLDFAMKKMGYEGSFSDKLIAAEKLFSHADDIWTAHKLRNKVVHEVGFAVKEEEVRKVLSSYKKALWDLGVKLI